MFVLFSEALACSRLRGSRVRGIEKARTRKKREETGRALHFRIFPAIWEPGTGYLSARDLKRRERGVWGLNDVFPSLANTSAQCSCPGFSRVEFRFRSPGVERIKKIIKKSYKCALGIKVLEILNCVRKCKQWKFELGFTFDLNHQCILMNYFRQICFCSS